MKTKNEPVSSIQPKKNKAKLGMKVSKISISLLVVTVFLFGYYVYNTMRKQQIYESMNISFTSTKEVEYGTADYDPLVLVDNISEGSITKYTKKVDTTTVGTKEIVFEVKKDDVVKEISVEVEVKDTIAPTISLKQETVQIYQGDSYDVKSNIASVTDVVDGEVAYSDQEVQNKAYYLVSSDLNAAKVGSYTVNVKALDSHANESNASYKVNVVAKPKKKEITNNQRQNNTNNNANNTPTTNAAASVDTSSVVSIANSYRGTRYRHGGTSPSGFDCSGFVQYVYKTAGKSVGRTSGSQLGNGSAVSESNLQPGDIIVWANNGSSRPSHSSIYVGNGQITHATSNKGVRTTTVSAWKSWGQHIVGIRRV